jgi:hypothetical protein
MPIKVRKNSKFEYKKWSVIYLQLDPFWLLKNRHTINAWNSHSTRSQAIPSRSSATKTDI